MNRTYLVINPAVVLIRGIFEDTNTAAGVESNLEL